ncbi:MAG: hypothetical protein ACP5IA_06240 [Sediminispirochaetaceae bacterium]
MGAEDISEKIRQHIKQLVKTAGLPDTEESIEVLEKGWQEKLEAFERQVEERDMELSEEFDAEDDRGALLMTYSGSLISVGPRGDSGRFVEYRSIGIRKDVPETAETDDTDLAGDVAIDESAMFTNGPIKKSSPIFKIAVIVEEMDEEDQEELLAEVTQMLTDDFIEVNKTIIQE